MSLSEFPLLAVRGLVEGLVELGEGPSELLRRTRDRMQYIRKNCAHGMTVRPAPKRKWERSRNQTRTTERTETRDQESPSQRRDQHDFNTQTQPL